MQELITQAQAEAAVRVLLVAGLLAGAVAFFVARRRSGGDPLRSALAAGGPPVLLWMLWRVYNAITERLGLDTVANLLVNLALFVTVGVLCGTGWAWLTARRRR